MSVPTRRRTLSGSAAVGSPRGIQREEGRANVRNSVASICRRYDVFLSFRGEDTRYNFSDYLDTSLIDRGVDAFRDDRDLVGEEIGPALFRAIANSQIAILVISKNYGGSECCLEELREILRCRRDQGQVVLPVFFNVDVSDVCEITKEFGEAFRELAKDHTPEQVKEWRKALRSLAGIGRWSLQEDADGRQGQLAKMLVDRVLSILKKGTSVFPISSPATKKALVSQLQRSLEQNNIRVFSDNDPDLIGKDLADETRNAMEHCQIFIPIFSEDFASSRDCLDELAEMVECCQKNGQKILPIFYKMYPSQVCDRFQEDMLQHNVQEYTRQQWRTSLKWVCSWRGLVSANIGNGNEGKLVSVATEKVCELLKKLDARSPSVEYLTQSGLEVVGPGGSPLKREIACECRGLSSGLPGVGVTLKWLHKACTFLNSYKNANCKICDTRTFLSTMLSFEDL